VQPGREPDRECLREIFVWMALRVPIFEVHDIATTERPRPVSIRLFLARCAAESLLALLLPLQLVPVAVAVPRPTPAQFLDVLRRSVMRNRKFPLCPRYSPRAMVSPFRRRENYILA